MSTVLGMATPPAEIWGWAPLAQLIFIALLLWLMSAYAVALRYGEALLAVIPWPDRRRPYRLVYLQVDRDDEGA